MSSKTSPPEGGAPPRGPGRPSHPAADRRLYGRGAGRPLSPRRQALVDAHLPRLALPEEGPLDPAALIPGKTVHALEIGFGGGEHLVSQAEAHRDWGLIGVEPFMEGVAKAIDHVASAGVDNVRVHRGDGRDVLERIVDGSLDRLFVLFPDPWPKTRHHKRRLIQPAFVAEAARVLKPGGRLRVATDVKSYVDWTLFHVRQTPAFAWTARRPDDWRRPPADHAPTRYETKNIGDCPPTYLEFVRA